MKTGTGVKSPIGIKVGRTAAREFWLNGELSCPCCPIFMEDQRGECWKLFFDDEESEWQIRPSNIPFPEIGFETGDSEYKWIDVELTDSQALIGKTLTHFSAQTVAQSAIGLLTFDQEIMLQVEHRLSDDTSQFVIKSGA